MNTVLTPGLFCPISVVLLLRAVSPFGHPSGTEGACGYYRDAEGVISGAGSWQHGSKSCGFRLIM